MLFLLGILCLDRYFKHKSGRFMHIHFDILKGDCKVMIIKLKRKSKLIHQNCFYGIKYY